MSKKDIFPLIANLLSLIVITYNHKLWKSNIRKTKNTIDSSEESLSLLTKETELNGSFTVESLDIEFYKQRIKNYEALLKKEKSYKILCDAMFILPIIGLINIFLFKII